MTTFIIDAFAWIEYLEGSPRGAKVRDIVEDKENTIIMNAITLAELASKFRRAERDFSAPRRTLLSLAKVQEVDAQFATDAGTLHAALRKERAHMGLADVFVLQTARMHNGKVVTGDQDFKGLKEVVMI